MQHSPGGQHGVGLIEAGHGLPQIHRDALSDARGDPQHSPFTARARQHAPLQRAGRRPEINRRHHPAAKNLPAEFHGDFKEIITEKPRAVPDQQLNGCLRAEQAFRPRPQRR